MSEASQMSEALALYASEVIVGAMERQLPVGELAQEIARREFPPSFPTLDNIEGRLLKEMVNINDAANSTFSIGFNRGLETAVKILRARK